MASSLLVGPCSDRLHVVEAGGAIIDLGDHGEGDGLVDGVHHLLRAHHLEHVAIVHQVAEALGNVEVRGEVAGIGENHPARRVELRRGPDELEQVDRDRIPGHHAPRGRTDQPGDAIAHFPGKLEPAVLVPGLDERLAPLLFRHLRHAGGHILRQHAQRIAVQVDQPLRNGEGGALPGQRVCAVQGLAIGSLQRRSPPRLSCWRGVSTPRRLRQRCAAQSTEGGCAPLPCPSMLPRWLTSGGHLSQNV